MRNVVVDGELAEESSRSRFSPMPICVWLLVSCATLNWVGSGPRLSDSVPNWLLSSTFVTSPKGGLTVLWAWLNEKSSETIFCGSRLPEIAYSGATPFSEDRVFPAGLSTLEDPCVRSSPMAAL